jgi:uncharacterized membrane-anchored protein YjiN (DUF445 family)
MVMNDQEFEQLSIAASICPSSDSWTGEHAHWQRLRACASEAQQRVSKAYRQMDEIDLNADLSRDDKYRQRSEAAAQAIADLEASKTLARACEAVSYVIQQWKRDEQHVSTEIAEAALKAIKEAETGWRRAIDKIRERASLTKGPTRRR